MTLTEHYRAAEQALERAEAALRAGFYEEAAAGATVASAHAQLASIPVPVGGRS